MNFIQIEIYYYQNQEHQPMPQKHVSFGKKIIYKVQAENDSKISDYKPKRTIEKARRQFTDVEKSNKLSACNANAILFERSSIKDGCLTLLRVNEDYNGDYSGDGVEVSLLDLFD